MIFLTLTYLIIAGFSVNNTPHQTIKHSPYIQGKPIVIQGSSPILQGSSIKIQ